MTQTRVRVARARVAPLEMVAATIFGHSFGSGGAGADEGTRAFDRFFARQRTLTPLNRAQPGTRMDQILGQIQTLWAPNSRGVVGFAGGCRNDQNAWGDNGPSTTAAAFRSCLAYLTAQATLGPSSSAFVYGPSWAAGSSSTVGAYVDLAFTGDAVWLLVNYVTGTGGTLVAKDTAGATKATITTGGTAQATVPGATLLSGFGAGSHTVRITLTAGSATIIAAAIPSPTPPLVIWEKEPPLNLGAAVNTQLAAYQSACAAVLSSFPTVVAVPASPVWDPATMTAPDGVHPNDLGQRTIADQMEVTLAGAPFRQGLNQLTAASAGTYTSPTASYISPGATAPAAPGSLTAATANPGVTGSWTAPTDGGATITGYVVQTSPAGANTWTTAVTTLGTVTTATASAGLTATSSYDMRVAAVNAVGQGAWSSVATATAGALITYAADTFNRADSTSLGSTETGAFVWAVSSGNSAKIASNQMAFAAAVSTAPGDIRIGDGQANGTIQATVTSGPTQQAGIVFRRSADSSTGYIFFHDASGVYKLYRRDGVNTYATIAVMGSATAAANDVLTVVLNGPSIACKVNGTTVLTGSDSTYSGTICGMWGNLGSTPTFDNFSHTSATS